MLAIAPAKSFSTPKCSARSSSFSPPNVLPLLQFHDLQSNMLKIVLQRKHSIAEEVGNHGAADREFWAGGRHLQSDSHGGPVHVVHLFC